MKQEKRVPKRRFREFSEAWNEQPFGEVFDTSVPTNTFARDDLNDVAGTVRDIHYGDVLIKYPAVVDARKEDIPYLNEGIFTIADERQYLQNGDIVMADTAEDETAGKVVELENAEEHSVVAGLHTMVLRPIFPFGAKFLGYKINAPSYHEQLIPLMQGTKVTSVNKQALSETNIAYPSSLAEQERIGEFLYRLDALISLHERKLQKLAHLKQAYLAEMFPDKGERQPRRRFKGFSGDWETIRLQDITTKIGSGKTPLGGSSTYIHDGIPLIRSQNVNHSRIDLSDVVFIDSSTDEEMKNSRVQPGDVLLNITGASIGRSAVYSFSQPANVNQHVCIIRPKGKIDSTFLQLHLESKNGQKQIDESQAGGAREGLNFKMVGQLHFLFPSRAEQQKIGAFFQVMDKKLQSEHQKLAKLRALKQAYLSELFV